MSALPDIYKPRARVGKYYLVLFSLPKWQYLVLALLLLSLTVLLIIGISSYPLLLNALLVFLYTRLYAHCYKETVFYKIKRSLGLALATLVYSSILLVLTKNTPLIITSTVTITITVILGLDGTNPSRYLIAVLPQTTTLIIMRLLNHITTRMLFTWVLILVLLVLVDVIIYLYMSRCKLGKVAAPDLGTLFLRNWLDRRIEIEEVFEKLGEEVTVNPMIIELGDVLVVYTDVHYGPFSNIGSSRLPAILSENFKRLGKKVLALHGLGSHDRNIVSAVHAAKYRERLLSEYLGGDKKELFYHGGFCSEYYEWRLCGIVFDKISVIFISRPYAGIDDLPYNIQVEYKFKAKKLGLGELILIDSHNWELQKQLDLDELRAALDNALKHVYEIKLRTPILPLHRHICFKAKARGLIDGDVCLLCIEGASRERFCLIYMRGNNMKPYVRDLLLKQAEPLGTDLVEVLTNDEHSETGIRASIIYIPVHESAELLRAIREKSEELIKTTPESGAWLYTLRDNVKLMGEVASYLEQLLETSIKKTAILLLAYVFLAPIALQVVLFLFGFA